MLDTHVWICPPQVKDLPRDAKVAMTCKNCGLQWGESVRQMVERDGKGAEFVDLLEWQYRCADEACGGAVRFAFEGFVMAEPLATPQVVTLGRPKKVERLAYPVKSVIKHRFYAPPMIPASKHRQLSLPL